MQSHNHTTYIYYIAADRENIRESRLQLDELEFITYNLTVCHETTRVVTLALEYSPHADLVTKCTSPYLQGNAIGMSLESETEYRRFSTISDLHTKEIVSPYQ